MSKEQTPCPLDAAFIVPWAGTLNNYCLYHANAMATIGEAIGAPIQIRPLEGNHGKCENYDLDEIMPKEKEQ